MSDVTHMYSCPCWPNGSFDSLECTCSILKVDSHKAQLADVYVELPTVIENPFLVQDAAGKLLGSAVVMLVADKFVVRLILDPNNPEAFDLTNEPARCKVDVKATFENYVLKGVVVLTSK